jgi:hypothetical protein
MNRHPADNWAGPAVQPYLSMGRHPAEVSAGPAVQPYLGLGRVGVPSAPPAHDMDTQSSCRLREIDGQV